MPKSPRQGYYCCMMVLLPVLAVALVAFCVWLTVRIVNRRERWAKWTLAAVVGVHHTYISKVESGKLDFALYPGEELVRKLAVALDGDETELLLLAKKVPPLIRDRVLARPDDFRKLATLDDAALDEVIRQVDRRKRARASSELTPGGPDNTGGRGPVCGARGPVT